MSQISMPGVVLTPGSNTLSGSGTSVNAAPVDLITFGLGALTASYRFQFTIIGRDTGTGDTVGYTVFGTVKTNGVAAAEVSTQFSDDDENDSLVTSDIDVVASGNNAILRAVGVAGQTVTYNATGFYVRV